MARSNYEITKIRARGDFLKYDQQRMIEKFRLRNDEAYLYIRFAGRNYRVERRGGMVEWSEDDFVHVEEAGFNEAMSIYDVLCYSKENCRLSGRFSKLLNLKGTGFGVTPGKGMNSAAEQYFDRRPDLLDRACERLGGTRESQGDIAWRLPVFDFLPLILQFWQSDDEFPPSLKVMWDENILDYVHYETTYYIEGHLMKRICGLMEQMEEAE